MTKCGIIMYNAQKIIHHNVQSWLVARPHMPKYRVNSWVETKKQKTTGEVLGALDSGPATSSQSNVSNL